MLVESTQLWNCSTARETSHSYPGATPTLVGMAKRFVTRRTETVPVDPTSVLCLHKLELHSPDCYVRVCAK